MKCTISSAPFPWAVYIILVIEAPIANWIIDNYEFSSLWVPLLKWLSLRVLLSFCIDHFFLEAWFSHFFQHCQVVELLLFKCRSDSPVTPTSFFESSCKSSLTCRHLHILFSCVSVRSYFLSKCFPITHSFVGCQSSLFAIVIDSWVDISFRSICVFLRDKYILV